MGEGSGREGEAEGTGKQKGGGSGRDTDLGVCVAELDGDVTLELVLEAHGLGGRNAREFLRNGGDGARGVGGVEYDVPARPRSP